MLRRMTVTTDAAPVESLLAHAYRYTFAVHQPYKTVRNVGHHTRVVTGAAAYFFKRIRIGQSMRSKKQC